MPIEAMVLVEAGVLGGDYGVLEIGRDLAERNELAAFAIRRVAKPGLQMALDVDCGRRRVDPAGGHEGQRSERPKKRYADDKPSDQGTEEAPATRVLGWGILHCSHDSE